MNIQDIHKSKTVRGILIGLGICAVALIIFQSGVSLGYNKARFASRFSDNYNRNFIDSRRPDFDRRFGGRGMPGGHGAVGKIVSISLPEIVVAGPDNLEKTIVVSTTTLVRQFQNEIKVSELKTGDFIVVLGVPNSDGQIDAKLIRMMPHQLK